MSPDVPKRILLPRHSHVEVCDASHSTRAHTHAHKHASRPAGHHSCRSCPNGSVEGQRRQTRSNRRGRVRATAGRESGKKSDADLLRPDDWRRGAITNRRLRGAAPPAQGSEPGHACRAERRSGHAGGSRTAGPERGKGGGRKRRHPRENSQHAERAPPGAPRRLSFLHIASPFPSATLGIGHSKPI